MMSTEIMIFSSSRMEGENLVRILDYQAVSQYVVLYWMALAIQIPLPIFQEDRIGYVRN